MIFLAADESTLQRNLYQKCNRATSKIGRLTVLFWFTFFDEVPPRMTCKKATKCTFFDLISDAFD